MTHAQAVERTEEADSSERCGNARGREGGTACENRTARGRVGVRRAGCDMDGHTSTTQGARGVEPADESAGAGSRLAERGEDEAGSRGSKRARDAADDSGVAAAASGCQRTRPPGKKKKKKSCQRAQFGI